MIPHPGVTPFLPTPGEVHAMGQPLCLCFQTPGRQRKGAQHLTHGDNPAPSMLVFCGSMLPAQAWAELTQRFAAPLAEVIPALLQPAQPGWEAVTHKHLPTSRLPLRSCFFKPQDSRETWPCSKVHAGGSGTGGGGKHRAIHNLCSTLESSCLANVKHCLGLFWAFYF